MMKRIISNCICLFIIAMFCLVPLGAIDLDQNNNTEYAIENVKNPDVDSIANVTNITAEDKDNDINNNSDVKEEKIVKTAKDSVSNQKGEPIDPNFNINVEDVDEGQSVEIEIQANANFTHYVELTLSGSDEIIPVKITNGYGKTTFNNIEAGEYSVTVAYDGDSSFSASKKTTNFIVRGNPNLSVTVKDICKGDDIVAEIHANDNINQYVEAKLVNYDDIYPVKLVNGYAKLTINKTLAPGKYSIIVKYQGNHIYKKEEQATTFTVKDLQKPNLRINIKDIRTNQRAVAEVHANENLNGVVEITTNNSQALYYLKLVNGYGKITLGEDFDPGNYSATVRFDGDDTFIAAENTCAFNVENGKKDPKLNVNVKIKCNDWQPTEWWQILWFSYDVKVTIKADSGFNGYVELTDDFNHTSYPVKIINGTSTPIEFTDCTKIGSYHKFTVSSDENIIYRDANTSVSRQFAFTDPDF